MASRLSFEANPLVVVVSSSRRQRLAPVVLAAAAKSKGSDSSPSKASKGGRRPVSDTQDHLIFDHVKITVKSGDGGDGEITEQVGPALSYHMI